MLCAVVGRCPCKVLAVVVAASEKMNFHLLGSRDWKKEDLARAGNPGLLKGTDPQSINTQITAAASLAEGAFHRFLLIPELLHKAGKLPVLDIVDVIEVEQCQIPHRRLQGFMR